MALLIETARQAEIAYRQLTSPLRLLPDFLIIGAQKAGTTSLYNYLIEHPTILPARRKEVHFFDQHFQKGVSWYRSCFPTTTQKRYREQICREKVLTGEASPEYLFYPHTAQKVAQLLPCIKLIVLLRNPVERAYSQYRHNIRWGHETLSFSEALDQEEERTREGRERAHTDSLYHSFAYQRAAYLARGLYADQLQSWLVLFPREQLLIISSEDFYRDPATIYQEVLTFLAVSHVEPSRLKTGYKAYNISTEADGPAQMEPE